MCELCDEAEDGVVYCQDCGATICFDFKHQDGSLIGPAYVTASGDLFCRRCGRQYDEAEEEDWEEDYDGFEYDPFDEPEAQGQGEG